MQKKITLKLLPEEAVDSQKILRAIAHTTGNPGTAISGYHLLKSSVDARGKTPWIQLQLLAFINEPFHARTIETIRFRDVHQAQRQVVIVGSGPAGLFAALKLIENGIRPILLERGKEVRARRRDLALINREGQVNPESNYCFGEGGAGTYSDGKLYTRSTKRGDVNRILQLFCQFGANETILSDAHPHIGTNKLPQIITAMRQQIRDAGGSVFFESKVDGIIVKNGKALGVRLQNGTKIPGDAVILATGHSARDIFEGLIRDGLLVEPKPFALGVRVEHPQSLIDRLQYHCSPRNPFLPPASYSLVQQVDQRGVFSFCMCPGGIIAPAATAPGQLVVNGWSPSKRNNPFANSGMVVSVTEKDYLPLQQKYGPLAALAFQREVEEKAFRYGGGKLVAPAQRMTDFTEGKLSATLPPCSYLPGVNSAPLQEVLPEFIYQSLRQAFREFGNRMRGYYTDQALVVATESRSSSPVRIPRDADTLQHPQAAGLFPCGEGAGYAGGIVSAAMDGERVAAAIIAAFA